MHARAFEERDVRQQFTAATAPAGHSRRNPGRPSGSGRPARPDTGALVLCGARLADGRTVDVRLGGGRIEAVGTAGSLAAADGRPRATSPATCCSPPPPSRTRTATPR